MSVATRDRAQVQEDFSKALSDRVQVPSPRILVQGQEPCTWQRDVSTATLFQSDALYHGMIAVLAAMAASDMGPCAMPACHVHAKDGDNRMVFMVVYYQAS